MGFLAESQEVEGADEPMQAILLNWKMSPTCIGNHFSAVWQALPHKNTLQVVVAVGGHVFCNLSCPVLLIFFFSSIALVVYIPHIF